MINLNEKKSKDRTLTSIASSKGIFVPTKGNEDEKIEKLRREIQ